MNHRKFARGLVAVCAVSAALMGVPSNALAFGGLFQSCWLSKQCSTPTFAASPCAPQVAQYVPQTCYRPVSVQVPVTTYSPVTSCNPCTGCSMTCMKPTTCLQTQTQMVPYTTYRLVITNPCGSSCCSTLCPQKAVASTATYAPAATSGCSTCGAAAATTYAQPATTNYAPAATTYVPSTTTYVPSTSTPAYTPAPATPTPAAGTPPQTFQNNGSTNSSGVETQLKPIPQPGPVSATPSAGTITPQLIDPSNRTTMAPAGPAVAPVSYPERAAETMAMGGSHDTFVPQTSAPTQSVWRASNR